MNFGHGEGCICRECHRVRSLLTECDEVIRDANRTINTLGRYQTDRLVEQAELILGKKL
jgi:hypothetical protein